jgi:hypothetical protein
MTGLPIALWATSLTPRLYGPPTSCASPIRAER